ncbi:MAG: hypothetical protein HOI53_00710 [Francisellaceae bacterium]|jgi:hypothetical protein|nr:hypothetical protein [Francisellaceae bacterium]MBT6206520.1 hypothetical protein [Francisellaceae bacterium]MBT6539408.1 hypothetical protein [Francisellaceae bacterium]
MGLAFTTPNILPCLNNRTKAQALNQKELKQKKNNNSENNKNTKVVKTKHPSK